MHMHILMPDAMPCFAQGGDSGGQYMSASGERLNTKDILALKDENVDDAVWVPGVCLNPDAPNPFFVYMGHNKRVFRRFCPHLPQFLSMPSRARPVHAFQQLCMSVRPHSSTRLLKNRTAKSRSRKPILCPPPTGVAGKLRCCNCVHRWGQFEGDSGATAWYSEYGCQR